MSYTVPGRPPQLSHCIVPSALPSPKPCQSLQSSIPGQRPVPNLVDYVSTAESCRPPPCSIENAPSNDENVRSLEVNYECYDNFNDMNLPAVPSQAKPDLKPSTLPQTCFILPGNKVFIDRILPPLTQRLRQNGDFPTDYFVCLHKLVAAATALYPPGTANYLGARIPLQHTSLNIARWRYHLTGYEGAEIIQFLEFGFPLGLSDNPPPVLQAALKNHSSSYQYFSYLDEFLNTGLARCELAGPCSTPPFTAVHVSPLMTAVKKPDGRRAVFDGTYGEYSLNNGTPSDSYLNHSFSYDFPKVEDFKRFVLECGQGCFIYKRDLSRYYLQLPIDPCEYPLLCVIWRKHLFFFVSFMFGLRHAGLQGQKVTRAVTWIHQRLGLDTREARMYNSLNYSDDIGGCEGTLERAEEAFKALGNLFKDLGLRESSSKAHPPSTSMPYLGIQFDTVKMIMSIPPEKVAEVREEVCLWLKKSTATKKTLQQLLGKLFWVSRCVRYSRGFMGRLLTQLQQMHSLPDNRKSKLSPGCRQDIVWWDRYLRRFNGVELLYPTDPLDLSLDQLLDTGALVNCGDAQPLGGGSYFGSEYWSRPFPQWLQCDSVPIHLKEFWVILVSAWLWGHHWHGKIVYIFCDNTAVVEVLDKERPKDPKMLELLREFLYIVCTRRFTPKFRRIGTKDNTVADFISRCHDPRLITSYFETNKLPMRTYVPAPDHLFTFLSNW